MTDTNIYDWCDKVVNGTGGYKSMEEHEMAAPSDRDVDIVKFAVRALANVDCEGSADVLVAIQMKRATAPAANEPTPGANDALAGIRKHNDILHADKWLFDVKQGNGNRPNPDKLILTPNGGYIHTAIVRAWEHAPADIATLLAALAAANERVAALAAERDTMKRAALDYAEKWRNELTDNIQDSIDLPDATAPTLESRLASGNRTIDRSEIREAIALVADGKVRPIEGVDYATMPDPSFGQFAQVALQEGKTGAQVRREVIKQITTPTEPPAPGALAAAKPSFDVPRKRTNQARTDAKKLTNPRERKIMKKIIDAGGWLSEGMLNKSERELCGKRPDLYHRENYGGRPGYAVTEIGRAALAALADATPDGGAKDGAQ